ncbi:hypothetical protein BO94DRAFT_532836 [Aspergillus sclerotioniger CBS 115572]|uniref:Uncharacterized protein n=1 Tax=Aspergillus sclerotioniger CBS 115572 TaxID=1450535 RepID=A0A317X326_9EURO|nr:hypothetical protein BO94DRAFT_532836 [Aspergillus sclerotioniger CBS 115572]PWY93029.1 hypothetical protein BO94DRAFT_532836 [Aspergillus sclerotioniger CBS 115572]
MRVFYLFTLFILSEGTISAQNVSYTELIEPLFLDFTLDEILQNNTKGWPIVEPWASEYVNSILEGRYGDAVWASYNIGGDVNSDTGIVEGTNLTVLESIEEDALGYRTNDPDNYAEALSFYTQTGNTDGHTDIVDMLIRIGQQDVVEAKMELDKRKTWGIRCSPYDLAYKSSCLNILERMSTAKTYVGGIRRLGAYG